MMMIEITRDAVALIDDEAYECLPASSLTASAT